MCPVSIPSTASTSNTALRGSTLDLEDEHRLSLAAKLTDVARKLAIVIFLALVFLVSFATSVYYTFRGSEVHVPGLAGKTIDEARVTARQTGLEVKVVAQDYDEHIAANSIISQEPEAGTKVKTGFTIRLKVSLGKKSP